MDNLINETNQRLQEIIDNLTTIKKEYENKLSSSNKEIEVELGKVKKYKEDFFVAKQKIEKMNADIEGFEADYQNLVDRFKDDELANILIAANKEISAKIDERKRKIGKDKIAMNDLVEKAELSKDKLVKLTAEKRALELCLAKILDSYEFYTKALSQIIEYSKDNAGNLVACFHEQGDSIKLNFTKSIEEDEDFTQEKIENALKEEYIIEDNDLEEENDNIEDEETSNDDEDMIDEDDTQEEQDDEEIESSLVDEDLDDEEIESEDIELDDEDITDDEDTEIEETEETEDNEDAEDDSEDDEEIQEEINEDNLIETDKYTIVIDDVPSVLYNFDDSIEDYEEDEEEEDEKKD